VAVIVIHPVGQKHGQFFFGGHVRFRVMGMGMIMFVGMVMIVGMGMIMIMGMAVFVFVIHKSTPFK
jgi:hypothetical protein